MSLEEELGLPLYAAAKALAACYQGELKALDLTYPQYLALRFLWEKDPLDFMDLGKKLSLDSGTLTPLVKRLEQKGLLLRERFRYDERKLILSITPEGKALEEKTQAIEEAVRRRLGLNPDEISSLSVLLQRLNAGLTEKAPPPL